MYAPQLDFSPIQHEHACLIQHRWLLGWLTKGLRWVRDTTRTIRRLPLLHCRSFAGQSCKELQILPQEGIASKSIVWQDAAASPQQPIPSWNGRSGTVVTIYLTVSAGCIEAKTGLGSWAYTRVQAAVFRLPDNAVHILQLCRIVPHYLHLGASMTQECT